LSSYKDAGEDPEIVGGMTGVWEQSPWWEVQRYGKEAPQKLNILHIFLISFAISHMNVLNAE